MMMLLLLRRNYYYLLLSKKRQEKVAKILSANKSQWYLLIKFRTDGQKLRLPITALLGKRGPTVEGKDGLLRDARQATMADTTLAGRFHRLNCLQSVKLSTCKSVQMHNLLLKSTGGS